MFLQCAAKSTLPLRNGIIENATTLSRSPTVSLGMSSHPYLLSVPQYSYKWKGVSLLPKGDHQSWMSAHPAHGGSTTQTCWGELGNSCCFQCDHRYLTGFSSGA